MKIFIGKINRKVFFKTINRQIHHKFLQPYEKYFYVRPTLHNTF
jgi:hypothetical protein